MTTGDAPLGLFRAGADGSMRRLWSGDGDVRRTTYDSHVPASSTPSTFERMLPITELHATVRTRTEYQHVGREALHGGLVSVGKPPHAGASELMELLRTIGAMNTPHYLAHGETFVRIKEWSVEPFVIKFTATTGRFTLATYPDGRYVVDRTARMSLVTALASVALTEPSPPIAEDEWFFEQRRAASDRLIAQAGDLCCPSVERTSRPEPATSP